VTTPRRTDNAEALDAMRRSHETYGYVTSVLELSKDGWYGDPNWATEARAKDFAETISSEIMKRLDEVLQTLGINHKRAG
jgi:creatinine amidohydrolase/Fe(II)-dependent formamide hydrolase-like protein